MADERRILAVSVLFPLLSALAATFQCCGFLRSLLMIQSFRQRQLTAQATRQYNASVARLLRIRRRINRRGRMRRSSGRTEQWWLNLSEREWKKNLRMNRAVFMSVADELRPFPGRSPRGLDVLSVEKQLAITLYFLKDQGSLTMTANAFGVAHCTVSVVVRKVCNIITDVVRPRYIKLPNTVSRNEGTY